MNRKDEYISVRLYPQERRALETMASIESLSISEMVRLSIRESAKSRGIYAVSLSDLQNEKENNMSTIPETKAEPQEEKIILLVDGHPESLAGFLDGEIVVQAAAEMFAAVDPRVVLIRLDDKGEEIK
jgi:hypothetical protein